MWMTGNHRSSMSWSLAIEGDGLLGVVRIAAVNTRPVITCCARQGIQIIGLRIGDVEI